MTEVRHVPDPEGLDLSQHECAVCGAVITLGAHDPDCGHIARTRLARAERQIADLKAELGYPTEMIDFPYLSDGDQ